MASSDSSGDTFDSAALSSGLFNAAGVQVKGSCGSSYISDVIRVERNGVESAVKILTPGATRDPEIVSRFLTNARYNQALNEFTQMPISEIVETGPRPYYVMDRVAQSSLLEVIRLHAPIDPHWLSTLLLPVARMIDTIHQRNVLHANIKPSNLLVVVENGQEKFLLVDYLEPSLAAMSATITGAGIYAAPEFRMGTPVSNRSDIYSLASVLYESMSGKTPNGAYRNPDGTFHVWHGNEAPPELALVNPEIPRGVSEIVMSGVSPQAIARPATATVMVEDILRQLEAPRSRVKVAEPIKEHAPVPMLLIGLGVFIATILLVAGFAWMRSVVSGDDSSSSTTASSSATTSPSTAIVTEQEQALYAMIPPDQQSCTADKSTGENKRWPLAIAILDCQSSDVSELAYGLFSVGEDAESTYIETVRLLEQGVTATGGSIATTLGNAAPCSATPNESGSWGQQSNGVSRGRFTCISTPFPRMVWTDNSNAVIGDASLPNGTIEELVDWWVNKAGPQ